MSIKYTQQLQAEINMLSKRCNELDEQLSNDTDLKPNRVKEMEHLIRVLKRELADSEKDKLSFQEKFRSKDNELKEALLQRKLAIDEYNEITDR